jgi:hypothetical protein
MTNAVDNSWTNHELPVTPYNSISPSTELSTCLCKQFHVVNCVSPFFSLVQQYSNNNYIYLLNKSRKGPGALVLKRLGQYGI